MRLGKMVGACMAVAILAVANCQGNSDGNTGSDSGTNADHQQIVDSANGGDQHASDSANGGDRHASDSANGGDRHASDSADGGDQHGADSADGEAVDGASPDIGQEEDGGCLAGTYNPDGGRCGDIMCCITGQSCQYDVYCCGDFLVTVYCDCHDSKLWCHPQVGPCVCDDAGTDAGCTPDCTNKICGDDDGCGGACDGPCPNPGGSCVNHTCIDDRPGTCAPDAKCGDWDSHNMIKCRGTCDDVTKICLTDPNTGDPTCQDDPCFGMFCGNTGVGVPWTCPGVCTTLGQSCRTIDPATQSFACEPCDPNGAPLDAACDANTACTCGLNCVTIPPDQAMGVCLEDCHATRPLIDLDTCTDKTQACVATQTDAQGNVKSAECYAHAPLTGNFTAPVMDDCSTTPVTGIGSLSYTIGGSAYKWTANLSACRTAGTKPDGTTYDLVKVRALAPNHDGTEAESVEITFDTSKVALGDLPQGFGRAVHVHQTLSGGSITAVSTVSFGVMGTANLVQAGTGGSKPIKGTINYDMLLYRTEICGGTTGKTCTN